MEKNDKLRVYACTLATFNNNTKQRYIGVGNKELTEVEVFEPFQDSLEATIRACQGSLSKKAQEINPSAIVVEAKYVSSDKFMPPTMYATGVVVVEAKKPTADEMARYSLL